MTDSYFRALLVEHPPVKYVAQAVAGGALIPSPFWISWLQDVNVVLATATGIGAFILTWAAVYRLVKHFNDK